MSAPVVTEFAVQANGSRNRGIMVEGVSVLVQAHERDDAHAADVARRLAVALPEVERLRARIAQLEREIPPARPAELLGPGVVRFRASDGSLWLLNRRDRGFGEWGVRLRDWDDLFRRFNVIVLRYGRDEHGFYAVVEPARAGAP